MKKNWKVEIRQDCKICGKPLPNARYRSYCSTKCRNKRNNAQQAKKGYSTAWQKAKRDKIASVPSPDKVKCLICGKYYVQVGTHAYLVHGITGREYREEFGLEVKRGTVPAWYRKKKGDQAIENETYKNLEAGAKHRFKKGQEGVGVYERSPVTKERLKKQGKIIGGMNRSILQNGFNTTYTNKDMKT